MDDSRLTVAEFEKVKIAETIEFFDQRDENTIMITAVRNRREAYR